MTRGQPAAAERLRAVPLSVWIVFAAGAAMRLAMVGLQRPGFVGYVDSAGFIENARQEIFGEVFRTAGYPQFLRSAHFFSDDLSFTVVVQHGLGVATAALLYVAARRLGAAVWTALLPAAVVLFGGTQLLLEHSLLSEGPFTFLLALSVALAAHASGSRLGRWWLGAAGVAIGAAATIRPAGLFVIPALALWALLSLPGRRLKAVAAGAVVVGAVLPVAGYIVVQRGHAGFTGLTQGDGWTLYARVAEFADCRRFEPPPGTRAVCERRDPARRHSANSYLYLGNYSPARRAFGNPPARDAALGVFARRAIVHQPLAYLRVVARDSLRAAVPGLGVRPGSGLTTGNFVEDLTDPADERNLAGPIALYWNTAGFKRQGVGVLAAYGKAARVEGPLTLAFCVLAVLGVVSLRGVERAGALLFALTGGALILAPAVTLFYDVRYATPAYGFLAGAGAFGLIPLSRAAAARGWRSGRKRRRPAPR